MSFLKQVIFAGVFIALTLSVSASDYTVTVGAGETNTVDAAFVTALGSANRLVKRGTGVLELTPLLSSYTGEIVAEEGVLLVKETGSLGTSAGATVVSNGASIVFKATNKDNCKFYSETFKIAGPGAVGEKGAFANIGTGLTGQNFRYLTLLDDATIYAWGELAIYAGKLDMNGKTLSLYVRNKDDSGNTSWSYSFSLARSRVVNPGHIVLETGKFTITGRTLPDGTAVWDGDDTNTLTIKPVARLCLSSSLTHLPWKLVMESTSGLYLYGDADVSSVSNNSWCGSVELKGSSLPFSYTSSYKGTMNLLGPLTGSGGFFLDGYTQLHLRNEGSFAGLAKATGNSNSATPLTLHHGRALPVNGLGLSLINANLPLEGHDEYALPKVSFTNSADRTVSGARTSGGTMAGFVKTGVGTVNVDARVTVTGLTDIAQGTLKLPDLRTAAAGLVHTWTNTLSDTSDYWYKVGPATRFPSPVRNTESATTVSYGPNPSYDGGKGCVTAYDGYIWNNETTNVTWSFMSGTESRAKLWIDESEKISQISYQYGIFRHVTLKPGANRFRYAVCLLPGSKAGAGTVTNLQDYDGNWHQRTDDPMYEWPKLFGFALNRFGTDSLSSNVFEKAHDAGNGLLFTVATNTAEMAALRPAFSNVLCRAGATFDLNGRDLTVAVPVFSGEGTVQNGILKVGERFVVRAAEVAKGSLTLTDADLVFADGAIVDVDTIGGLDRSRHVDNPYVIVTGGTAFASAPAVSDALAEKGWRTKLSDDSESILLYREANGMLLLLR